MGVRIDQISVKDLGPIKDFSVKLGLFNIIYSRNEKGKTFLTEFLIRSLFRNIERWRLRGGGSGKIEMSGLEKNNVEFSPNTEKKLEDYWGKDERGLPPSLAKLLVVKGGEAEIENTEQGVSKYLVKEVLSGLNILDKIGDDNNISKTVKSAQICDGQIGIHKTGEGKQYTNIREELVDINQLFEAIEAQYTQGVLRTYRIEEEVLQKRLKELEKAKRHEAYLISEKIKKLESELTEIPEDVLSQIETTLSLSRSKKDDYDRLKLDYDDARNRSKDYDWLQNVLPSYKESTTQSMEKPSSNLLIIAGILFAAAIVLVLFDQKFFSIAALLVSLVPIGMYIRKLHSSSKYVGQSEELNKIKVEFKERIGEELTNIALLQTVLKEQGESNSKSLILKEQLESVERELRSLHSSVQEKIFTLVGKEIGEAQWNPTLRDLKQTHKDLNKQITGERERLFKLGIDETDYSKEEAEVKYSQEEHKKVELEIKETRERITDQEKQLENLRYEISKETKEDPTLNWERLIESLRQKRKDVERELKEITSTIAAGISVHNVIVQLRKEEDSKIQERLESDTVLSPLREITRRYNKLTLEGEKIIVSDEYDNFDLKDLSTGAKEQIMLALRLGLSSKLLREDRTFLILDDAIQHCDWQNRKSMVKHMAAIAKNGWQIIYLTMDNYIRDLFDEEGKSFGGDYINKQLG